MVNVNAKMKETLDEVGRSSDKLCVDIMCIVSVTFCPCIIIQDIRLVCSFSSFIPHCCLFPIKKFQLLAVGFAGIFYKMSKGEW